MSFVRCGPDSLRRTTIAPSAAAPCAWNMFFAKPKPMMSSSSNDAFLPSGASTPATMAHQCRTNASNLMAYLGLCSSRASCSSSLHYCSSSLQVRVLSSQDPDRLDRPDARVAQGTQSYMCLHSRPDPDPTDIDTTSASLFMTHWITHLRAPGFLLLAGVSRVRSLSVVIRDYSPFCWRRAGCS